MPPCPEQAWPGRVGGVLVVARDGEDGGVLARGRVPSALDGSHRLPRRTMPSLVGIGTLQIAVLALAVAGSAPRTAAVRVAGSPSLRASRVRPQSPACARQSPASRHVTRNAPRGQILRPSVPDSAPPREVGQLGSAIPLPPTRPTGPACRRPTRAESASRCPGRRRSTSSRGRPPCRSAPARAGAS